MRYLFLHERKLVVQLHNSAGKGQKRSIKRESITVSFFFALQAPQAQGIDRNQRRQVHVFYSMVFCDDIYQLPRITSLAVNSLEKIPDHVTQPGGGGMFFQSFSQLTVRGFEQVLSGIPQKMKMADKVPDTGKNQGYCFTETGPHVMDTGNGGSVVVLQLLKKRHDMVGMFAGDFYIAQYNLLQTVHPGHQYRCISFMGGIQMQYVSAVAVHGLFNARCGLPVRQCEIEDEFAPKILDFRRAQLNISEFQFMAYLIGCQTSLEKAFTDKNKDIPGHIATPGNDVPQIF
jgi:hypothetical protein